MRINKEIRYSDMTETELQFLFDALKHRNMELEAECKRLTGCLAQVRVAKYMGDVQYAR